jgi:hypothetical protein
LELKLAARESGAYSTQMDLAKDRFWHETDMAGMPQFIDPHRDTRTDCLRSSSANKGAERQ